MATDEEKAQSAAKQQQQQQQQKADLAHDSEKGHGADPINPTPNPAATTEAATADSTTADEAAAAPADAVPLAPVKQRIPRSERRGLFGWLTLVPELADPKTTGTATKWLMTVIVATAAGTSSTGTSISYRKSRIYGLKLGRDN